MVRFRWLVATVVILSTPCFVDAGVHGRVYLDANGNGKLDADEKPLAGCIVSDGRQLVRTDAAGHYELPNGEGPVTVFVVNRPYTRPSGRWWATLADGHAANEVDFGLAEEAQKEPLLFLQGTDLHVLQRPDVANFYRQYLEHVNAIPLPLRFVVHTGDLVVDALPLAPKNAEKLYEFYEQGIARLRLPLRHVIGNHEHVGVNQTAVDICDPDYGKAMYRRRLGPTSYAFRFGRYHLIALDCTTLNLPNHGYRDRLDDASIAWAERYLATLHQGEPVILMVHQPLTKGDTDQRLLKALAGKNLILTICGHGHDPTVSRWGGAPQVMGGAVSYAWHGYVPYPPDPRAYVLYRIENGKVEYVYQDWAVERSFAVTSPTAAGTASHQGTIAGTITDFDGSIRSVTCKLADRQAKADVKRAGHFVAHFEAPWDYSTLDDGVYDLMLEATDGTREFRHTRPVIVHNGKPQPFPTQGQAILRFRTPGQQDFQGEVLLNGQKVSRIEEAGQSPQDTSFAVPTAQLVRLNTITLRASGSKVFWVHNLRIEIGDRKYRDVRFAPGFPCAVAGKSPKTPREVDYYIDLTYRGPRGS
jgi:3',5'-cyclic AMP phosphodiesterase CpdA